MSPHKKFLTNLRRINPKYSPEKWVFIPYDQLNDKIGALGKSRVSGLGIVLCESAWKPLQRPYHKQKLAHLLSNQRHFALEQAKRGIRVEYLMGAESYRHQLAAFIEKFGPLEMAEAAERELRTNLAPLIANESIKLTPHEAWLTTREDFAESKFGSHSWRMDKFYRAVRQRTGILMTANGEPLGGRYSFDSDNRKPWRHEHQVPSPLLFDPDEIVQEVCDFVGNKYKDFPGQLNPKTIVATKSQAEETWDFAKRECLTLFGPYEDAMTISHRRLFHTGLSELLNLSRILPRDVVEDVLAMDIPINSKEGFVRQVLGWREFVRHVHVATDGFRLDRNGLRIDKKRASFLGRQEPLPPVFWGKKSNLYCLDHVVEEVMDDAYTHHINRLMILSNWANLLDVDPEQINTWFWACFTDAYDWVVEPNVIGMGSFAAGDVMTTKPYISGSAYVNKMSDYCKSCIFNPKKDCPMTSLYWAFLKRHETNLSHNPRLKIVMAASRKRSTDKQKEAEDVYQTSVKKLGAGEPIYPSDFAFSSSDKQI